MGRILSYARLAITLIENYEEKIEKIAQITQHVNVTGISGVPTWNIVLAKRLLEITGKDDLLEIWPNLELYVHGAVSFTPYRDHFKKLVPSDTMYYMETYNASEGFFGIQDQSDSEEMLLMLDYGVFYEFLPIENLFDDDPKTLLLHEVEISKNYALVISTKFWFVAIYDWRYGSVYVAFTFSYPHYRPYQTFYQCFWRRSDH